MYSGNVGAPSDIACESRAMRNASKWLWMALAATFVGVSIVNSHLQTPSAVHGMVSFQLCAFDSSCEAILKEWDAPQREMAMFSLGFDYLFIPLYACALVAILKRVQRRLGRSSGWATSLAVTAVLVAAFCDVVENLMLVQVLQAQAATAFSDSASYLAALKFVLLGLAALWAVVGLVVSWRSPREASQRPPGH